jgi:hypothetical protein
MRKLFRELFGDPDFRHLLLAVLILLLAGMIFFHYVEEWRWFDSFYFSVITLATVGYGDFVPHTDLGKLFTMFYVMIGVGILLAFLNIIAHHAQEHNPIANFLKPDEEPAVKKPRKN